MPTKDFRLEDFAEKIALKLDYLINKRNCTKLRYFCVTNELSVGNTYAYLASYSHANFRHKTLPPCELFKRIGECGVNQHFGIVSGNLLEELKVFASLMGFDLYVIE